MAAVLLYGFNIGFPASLILRLKRKKNNNMAGETLNSHRYKVVVDGILTAFVIWTILDTKVLYL